MRSVVASCVICVVALSALAEDVEQEIWLYEHAGESRQLDVTLLDAETRQALVAQMTERGFERVAVDLVLEDEEHPIDSDGDGEDDADEEASRKGLREDLETLLRNGGRFPEGYQPAKTVDEGTSGAKPGDLAAGVGAVLLRYFEVKDDARRAPIYESALKALAKVLRDGKGADRVLMWLEASAAVETDGKVYREILHMVVGRPDTFGGADIASHVHVPLPPPDGDAVVVRLGAVPAGSLAARMGLAEGDAILEIDGAYPTYNVRAAAERRIRAGGKLRLRIRRKEGQMELLEFEFEDEPQALSDRARAREPSGPGNPNSGDK